MNKLSVVKNFELLLMNTIALNNKTVRNYNILF